MKLAISNARACGVSTASLRPTALRRAGMRVEISQVARVGHGLRLVRDQPLAREVCRAPLDDRGDLGEIIFRVILHAPECPSALLDFGGLDGANVFAARATPPGGNTTMSRWLHKAS